ncbi:Glyoxylase, beta-lactamase superfamily II [Tindallia magadiensis]|uniref:Glyoxylase, beta-lactamase superfamily II n=1 Tax=Tindallia magadiensis TaxID=69895 RepID=A0A1I3AC56_9FIRM|nr:MBL fold metallo-hydrolase [Tindallia magadiensis]SFH46901.1 Glyoxylase, beta-lactamase superfamily II [Tindallia magadiensis]
MFSYEKIITGPLQVNTYLVTDDKTSECIVIDPGGEATEIIAMADKKGWKITKIVLTHGHGDHIGGLDQLKKELNVPIYIHEKDAPMIEDGQRNFTAMMGDVVEISADHFLADGDTIELGNSVVNVIHTPGHTQGGICLLADKMLFSGDTLFMHSIGRTDLEGGNLFQLLGSIKNKLLVLDETIRVFPGHGPDTTIKLEKTRNPHLQ